ncbi:hypothetical protein PINS_up010713 [Pythium insidiosum]|nr:hypothetical protein PINS_up010713 [Pythium insidiosum]
MTEGPKLDEALTPQPAGSVLVPLDGPSLPQSFVGWIKSPSPTIQLHLTPPVRRAMLCLLLGAELCCSAYLFAVGKLYAFLTLQYMKYFANLIGPPEDTKLEVWGRVYTALAVLHLVDVGFFVMGPIISPCLPRWSVRVRPRDVRVNESSNGNSSRLSSARQSFRAVSNVGGSVFGRRGLLGIESDYFTIIYIIREALEISSQCFQLRRSNQLITRVWLNNTYTAMIVLNCFTTPLIQLALRGRTAIQRILCLAADTIVCMGLSILVPLMVCVPWALKFDKELLTFPPEIISNNDLFMKLVREHQAYLASSVGDGIAKIIPHLAMWSTLRAIREIVDEARPRAQSANAGPSPAQIAKLSVSPKISKSRQSTPRFLRALNAAVHIFFAGLGIFVFSAQIVAQYGVDYNNVVGCQQIVYPWFTTKPSCSIYVFHCHHHHVVTPGDGVFDSLNMDAIGQLEFRHCTDFVMPKSIQKLNNMLGLLVYNATSLTWRSDAMLHPKNNKHLTFIMIGRANMSSFPLGLMEPLPLLLRDIEFSMTNLTALPSDLAEVWPPMTTFYVEHSLLTDFPEVLLRLAVDDLSLIGNHIETVPAFADNIVVHGLLALAGNPIRALPDTIAEGSSTWFFLLDDTQLAAVPNWLGDFALWAATMSNTPFCVLHNSTDTAIYSEGTVTCERSIYGPTGRMPIAVLDAAM